MMFDLGGSKVVVVLLVALVVLGPQELPKVVRTYGKVMGELRKMSSGLRAQVDDALQDPLSWPIGEVRGGGDESQEGTPTGDAFGRASSELDVTRHSSEPTGPSAVLGGGESSNKPSSPAERASG